MQSGLIAAEQHLEGTRLAKRQLGEAPGSSPSISIAVSGNSINFTSASQAEPHDHHRNCWERKSGPGFT